MSSARVAHVTPLRVAFDAQIFLQQQYGGISRYICALARELAARHDVEARVIAPLYINSHLQGLPRRVSSGYHMRRVPKTGWLLRSSAQLLSPRLIDRFAPAVVHHTYYFNGSYAPRSSYRVVTVHDMIHERFSKMFPPDDRTAAMKREALQSAHRVICVSEATRRDLLDFFDIDPRNVFMVHHGFDTLESPKHASKEARMQSGRPYILYVGARHGYKNFIRLISAYASSTWLRKTFRIVCFGGGAFGAPDRAVLEEYGVRTPDEVCAIGGHDGALAESYRGAAALVYPSLYEGFGLPLLEAMSLDCPVVCSNAGALPEVGGNAVEHFDPLNVESMRDAMERVLQSPTVRSLLIARGRARCASFSWERCASETLRVYSSVAGG